VRALVEAFYVGGYWGARREPVGACASRLEGFLRLLAGAHPLLDSWFLKGDSGRSAVMRRRELGQELRGLLLAGQARRDDDRSVMDELGFRVGLWSGDDAPSGLMVTCGASPRTSAFGNAVVLNLPLAEGAALSLYRGNVAHLVMAAMVSSWEPSWATFTSHRLRKAQNAEPREVVVGWMTYLGSGRTVATACLPRDVTVETMGDGRLITIGDDPVAVTESAVTAVRLCLDDALGPA
jgi:hypothetical protein